MKNRIKELRMEYGFTIRDLEEKTGIANSHISKMENGKRSGTIQQLLKTNALICNLSLILSPPLDFYFF